MPQITIGTASWTDKSLIASKRFYPRGCSSAEDRLRFYASQFPVVEVDSSYYAMPSAANSRLWVERTPASFVFNIKAFRLFTGHQTAPASLPRDIAEALGPPPAGKKNFYYADIPGEIRDELWDRYRDAITPLRGGGKLGAVLFQFAPWVAFHPRNREHIDECLERLAGFRLAVEFRNKSWFEGDHCDRTLAFERERGLVNVIVDEPNVTANSIPSVWEVTVPELAIVRLHGRNHATWNIKGEAASERFNYDYTDKALEDLGRKISDLPVERAQVIFNNNCEDQGQRNARTLQSIIAQACRQN
ncbi:MAG: DUF72 domain-containing protein [Burkholderiales bacterium]